MSSSRPNLLFLSQTLPFPPDGGVNIRTFNILKLLSRSFNIYAICFYRKNISGALEASVAGLREYVNSIDVFDIQQEYNPVRLVTDHVASCLSQKVYTNFAYKNLAAISKIKELLDSEPISLVHFDSLDLSGYLPFVAHLPIVCVHHNIESVLLRRRADVHANLFSASYLRFQAALMEREEKKWCPNVALNVTCSSDDKKLLQSIAPSATVKVVPNGVDVETFKPSPQAGEGIVFVGGMTWFPNRDALSYFVDEILPALDVLSLRPTVTWVGRSLPGSELRFGKLGIRITGYVKDIRPYVHGAGCYIVPLRVGGGTRLKILDAWAMGKAVVSTSIGCEGLDAVDGYNILIRDDPQSFAHAVLDVLTNTTLRESLAANARTTAESKYSWESIGTGMIEHYLALLATS